MRVKWLYLPHPAVRSSRLWPWLPSTSAAGWSPRSDYPEGKTGYKEWPSALARFHAETTGEILADVGYDDETIRRVQSLIRKEQLKRDAEAQCLEDVACLVFLESYFADFAQKHDEAKLIDILQKTWKKMSAEGHAAALGLALPEGTKELGEKALAG